MTKKILGHPRGLFVLFFAEMWERLSYYGMRGLLVLYLTKVFMFSDEQAYVLYGSYTALVYATPVFGGYLADRLLGCRKAVTLGGILMVLGHFVMAIEDINAVYLALALIVIGNGFFKPNISTIVGLLYEKGDSMRDAGFTIFYMGINLGAFMQLFAGILGEEVGWHWGFGFAGLGMVLGLAVFLWGQRFLDGKADPPEPEKLSESAIGGLSKEWAVYIGSAIAVVIVFFLIKEAQLIGYGMNVLGVGVAIALIGYALVKCDAEERGKLFAALILIATSVVFWACFEQAGSSMNLFTDRNVDRHVFGYEISTTAFQSVNPLFIIIFAIPFSLLWATLAKAGKEPSTPMKFGLGIIQLGLGFGMLWYGAQNASADGQTALIWLVLAYMLHTTGELCVSPIGLSMVTKLSPKAIVSFLMGTWFLATAYAQYVAALIAKLTAIPAESGADPTAIDATQTVVIYGNVYGKVAAVTIIIGFLFVLVSPLVRKMMKDVH